MEVSPPGWKGTVQAMKLHPKISNSYALAWWMYNRGFIPHHTASEAVSHGNLGKTQFNSKKYPEFKYPEFETETYAEEAFGFHPGSQKGAGNPKSWADLLPKPRVQQQNESESLPPGPDEDESLSDHRIHHAKKSPPAGYPTDKNQYADPNNFKYPLDSAERVRSAISYFTREQHKSGYKPDEKKTMWKRILKAAEKFGIEVSDHVKKNAEAEMEEDTSFTSLGQLLRPQGPNNYQKEPNILDQTNPGANYTIPIAQGKVGTGKKRPIQPSQVNKELVFNRTRASETPLKFETPLIEAKIKNSEKQAVEVILMTEGLGNRKDMNYYTSKCIQSAVPLFEGAQCYVNHPSQSEEIDRPERDVRDLVGYYTNVKANDDGTAMIADLILDKSQLGKDMFEKIKEAIAYKDKYPDKNYFAISINANGDTHKEEKNGEEINVVDGIKSVESADLVTKPALQTKFVKLLASLREAENQNKKKEALQMKSEALKALCDEVARCKKTAAESEADDVQQISDLAKSLDQIHKAISPHDQLIGSEGKEALLHARRIAKTAESEDDMNELHKALKVVHHHLKNAHKEAYEAEKESEDEKEKESKASEKRSRKEAEAEESESESEAKRKEKEHELFKKAVKQASEAEDGKEDEDEKEHESESESESEYKKKMVLAHKVLGHIIKAAEGDGRTTEPWMKAVKNAQKILFPVSKASEAEDEDEKESKRHKANESLRYMHVSNLRESVSSASSSAVERMYDREYDKLQEAKNDPAFFEKRALKEATSKVRKIMAQLNESKLRKEIFPIIMDQLLECDSAAEVSTKIRAFEIAQGGNYADNYSYVSNAPIRESSSSEENQDRTKQIFADVFAI